MLQEKEMLMSAMAASKLLHIIIITALRIVLKIAEVKAMMVMNMTLTVGPKPPSRWVYQRVNK